jgi:integrase
MEGEYMPKLTKRVVDAARYQGGPEKKRRDFRWDSETRGFGVRIYPSGAKSFVVQYRTRAGRVRLLTIGAYGPFTVEQARARAKEELRKVANGVDPMVERRMERNASTVRELAAAYLDRWAKREKKSWPDDKRRLDNYVTPALGHLALSDVKRADVAALHHKVGERGRYEANRVLALVSVMFSKAAEWGFLADGARNPAAGIKPFKEKERDRWVKPAEMPKLAKAIGAEPNVYIRSVLWLFLTTGCRRNELLTAKWEDVDAERREIRLPDTKDGNPHVVPLSTAAWAVLEQVPRQKGNPHIFCGHKKGTHLVNIARAWRRIRTEADCEDVRLHDLRRTVGSWMATAGASLPLIGAVLNHADTDTTRIYARLADDATRIALEDHGERLLDVVRGGVEDPAAERARRIAELEAELAKLRGGDA